MTRGCEKRGGVARTLPTEVGADNCRIPRQVSGEGFRKMLRRLSSQKLLIHFENTSFKPVIKIRTR